MFGMKLIIHAINKNFKFFNLLFTLLKVQLLQYFHISMNKTTYSIQYLVPFIILFGKKIIIMIEPDHHFCSYIHSYRWYKGK